MVQTNRSPRGLKGRSSLLPFRSPAWARTRPPRQGLLYGFPTARLFQACADVGPAVGKCACHTTKRKPYVAASPQDVRQESEQCGEASSSDQQKLGRASM